MHTPSGPVPCEGLAGVESSCLGNQDLGEIGIDPPVPDLIGIRQGVSRDLPPDAQMIQLALRRPETGLDIPQALPVGELGKRHAEELIPAGEALDLVVAIVAFYTVPEIVDGDEVHQLGEYGATRVHEPSPSASMQKYGPLQKLFSNRLQPFLPAKYHQYLFYRHSPFKRWDSSDVSSFFIALFCCHFSDFPGIRGLGKIPRFIPLKHTWSHAGHGFYPR